jgi:hypothetical protein
MNDTGLSSTERTNRFRKSVRANGGCRKDVALQGEALKALDVVLELRGFRYPRQLFSTLLVEEQARLEHRGRPERPALTSINAGLIVRSILSCLPEAQAERQRALTALLGPLLRVAIESAHASGELSLLQLLAFIPVSDGAVQRALALCDAADVSVTARREFTAQAKRFLARPDRESDYALLSDALESLLWHGLLRA